MAVNIEPDVVFTNFLRSNLTDINSSRSGQWIFPDFPRIASLGDTSFPRIAITIISDSSEYMGVSDDTQWHTVNFQIDCVTKKDLIFSRTITDEALGTVASTSNSDRMVYDFIPNTITNIQHNAVSYGTVTFVSTDADFTTPASLAADTIEVSRTTGNLNFNATDLAADVGEAITSTYVLELEGKKCVQYMAREVIKATRANWRTDTTFDGLEYPKMISNSTIPIDEEIGFYRQAVEYQCNAINIGEGL